ncbi:PIG-L deacetylase family protein [Leptolyngbya sp. AN03gr2]|uniref:PIG-L deacetylase family protein n=1 Tax=unclassified Leptolyngbya TaxID=2650499 RepID=UPI003D315A7B
MKYLGRLVQVLHFYLLSQWTRYFSGQIMTVSDRPSIIIAPHQDDETLGCGGLIALKRQAGITVAVVFLTDGDNNSLTVNESCEDSVSLRRQEAIAALQILGVSTSDIYFLNYPDGQLQTLSEPEQQQFIAQLTVLIEHYQAQEVYVPHSKDGHSDHEMAFQTVQATLTGIARNIKLFQYPIWLFWQRTFPLQLTQQDLAGACRLNIAAVRTQKQTAIQVYQSQLPSLPFSFLRPFRASTELFFVQPTNL